MSDDTDSNEDSEGDMDSPTTKSSIKRMVKAMIKQDLKHRSDQKQGYKPKYPELDAWAAQGKPTDDASVMPLIKDLLVRQLGCEAAEHRQYRKLDDIIPHLPKRPAGQFFMNAQRGMSAIDNGVLSQFSNNAETYPMEKSRFFNSILEYGLKEQIYEKQELFGSVYYTLKIRATTMADSQHYVYDFVNLMESEGSDDDCVMKLYRLFATLDAEIIDRTGNVRRMENKQHETTFRMQLEKGLPKSMNLVSLKAKLFRLARSILRINFSLVDNRSVYYSSTLEQLLISRIEPFASEYGKARNYILRAHGPACIQGLVEILATWSCIFEAYDITKLTRRDIIITKSGSTTVKEALEKQSTHNLGGMGTMYNGSVVDDAEVGANATNPASPLNNQDEQLACFEAGTTYNGMQVPEYEELLKELEAENPQDVFRWQQYRDHPWNIFHVEQLPDFRGIKVPRVVGPSTTPDKKCVYREQTDHEPRFCGAHLFGACFLPGMMCNHSHVSFKPDVKEKIMRAIQRKGITEGGIKVTQKELFSKKYSNKTTGYADKANRVGYDNICQENVKNAPVCASISMDDVSDKPSIRKGTILFGTGQPVVTIEEVNQDF